MDDIILTGSSSKDISSLLQRLRQSFALKDLGPLHHFLGIEVVPNNTGMVLSQQKYILDLLARTHMLGSKPCHTSMATSSKLTREGTPLSDPSLYRHVVGALQYLTLTRTDLSFSMNKVCQFMCNPTKDHWAAVK